MARYKQIFSKEYLRMAKENEALWAVVGVLAMVIFLEIYQWV